MHKRLIVAVAVLLALTASSAAQNEPPSLKQTTPPATLESRAPLRLEVSYNPSLLPAVLDIHAPNDKPSWVWVTRFVPTPGWQLPADSLPIRAVRLEPQFNGETIDVIVTVLRGRETHEEEGLVAKYHLSIGDHRTLTELRTFGIEPFDIAVTNTVSTPPPPPLLDIRTGAVEVIGVESVNLPLAGYTIRFRNLADKRIVGLKVDVINGVSAFFLGRDGLPLIEPRAVLEEYLADPRAAQHDSPREVRTILVSSAVFDDGSFDGAVGPACLFESLTSGRLLWLKQIVPLLERELAENDEQSTAKQFREKVVALQLEISDVEKKRPSTVSPSCELPATRMSSIAQPLRLELLRDLDKIISTRPAPPVNFKSWLQSKKARYAEWLSRIDTGAR